MVVLGDLNEFEFVSPVATILGDVLVNTTNSIPEDERYTFIFQGNSQSLDHVLLSPALAERATVDIVHVNVEFEETPARASDHDPVVVALAFGNRIEGTARNDLLIGTDDADVLLGLGGHDLIFGRAGDDVLHWRKGPRHAHRRRRFRPLRLSGPDGCRRPDPGF